MKSPQFFMPENGKLYNFRSLNSIFNKNEKNPIQGYLFGYRNSDFLENNTVKFTFDKDVIDTSTNEFNFYGRGIRFSDWVLDSFSPRTFIFHVTLVANKRINFVYAGFQDSYRIIHDDIYGDIYGGGLFSLNYGYNIINNQYEYENVIMCNFHNEKIIVELEPSTYILAFVYDGRKFYIYKNGQLLSQNAIQLHTLSIYYRTNASPYSIGYSADQWRSKFGIVYNRALRQQQIALFNEIV